MDIKSLFKNKKFWLGAILVAVGILTHFPFIDQPPEVVFDEVYYGKFVNGYLSGEYFFSGHPPLGVELTALGAWLGGYQPHFKFENIGEKLTDNSYIAIRFAPNLAGSFIPLVIFIFALTLGIPIWKSFFIGLLLVFENALLTQSRFILIDSFLILFGFLGLILFFCARKRNYSLKFLIPSSVFFGMAFAVKWTGLSFILIAGIIALWDLIEGLIRRGLRNVILARLAKYFLCFLILPILVYAATFYIHFKLLPRSGPGDVFMTKEFLDGKKNFIDKFIELNKTNYYSNVKNLTATHPYSSKFYTWPFMTRPVYYWVSGDARIYLIGNPVIWWSSTLAVLLLIFFIIKSKFRDSLANFLLLGYALNLVPFLSIKRVLFLYHYLSALIFAVMILVYLLGKFKNYKMVFVVFFFLVIGAFLYFSPLTYGFNLSPKQYENRIWLESWR